MDSYNRRPRDLCDWIYKVKAVSLLSSLEKDILCHSYPFFLIKRYVSQKRKVFYCKFMIGVM